MTELPRFRFTNHGFTWPGSDPFFKLESWETEAINIHAALGLFAKEFSLTELEIQNYDWLWAPNTLSGYTKDSECLQEFCGDCNDFHGYWTVDEVK